MTSTDSQKVTQNTANATPIGAFTAAENSTTGFIGWSSYRGRSVGLHAADGHVEAWTADGDSEWTIPTNQSPQNFLDEFDEKMPNA